MIKKIKDEIQLSKFDVIDFLDDGETVIAFLMLAIAEGDEDFIAKCIKDVARAYDKIKNQIADLSKKVHILNEANMKLENELGQFAEASKTIERLKDRLDNAHRTLCEVLRMSLSDEKDISKIYDIVNPTLEKLNQPLTQYKQRD